MRYGMKARDQPFQNRLEDQTVIVRIVCPMLVTDGTLPVLAIVGCPMGAPTVPVLGALLQAIMLPIVLTVPALEMLPHRGGLMPTPLSLPEATWIQPLLNRLRDQTDTVGI